MAGGNLRATHGYLYQTDQIVGKGATCEVYKGVSKTTGETHALKIFMGNIKTSQKQQWEREIDVLSKVCHKNIVTMIRTDEEIMSKNPVLVMELCDDGSLQSQLQNPENAHGLDDAEFLLLMRHLCDGMKHLKLHGYVHRDIKPGNILRTLADDGSSIYKLSDFGTARLLGEEETFQSLVGTEEYLHPAIFEAAFMKRSQAPPNFPGSVDLWSIGATLYHSATGRVPFRSFGGRKNRHTMYEIITMKPAGVISGYQHTDKGPTDYSQSLPKTARISKGLHDLITPIIAGTMEIEPNTIWTFDQLFSECALVLKKIPLHVFNTMTASSAVLYLDCNSCFNDVQAYIADQTKICPEDQLLYFKGKPLLNHVDRGTPMSAFPNTSNCKPVVLMFAAQMKSMEEPMFYTDPLPDFDDIAQQDDYNTFKKCCTYIADHMQFIQEVCISQKLFLKSIRKIKRHFQSTLERDCQMVSLMRVLLQQFSKRVNLPESSSDESILILSEWVGENGIQLDHDSDIEIQGQLQALTSKLAEIEAKHVDMQGVMTSIDLSLMMKSLDNKQYCYQSQHCLKTVQRTLSKAKDLTKRLQDRRGRMRYDGMDQKMQSTEKKMITSLCRDVASLLSEHCQKQLNMAQDGFAEFHKSYIKIMIGGDQLRKDMAELRDSLVSMGTSINELQCPKVKSNNTRSLSKKLTTELASLKHNQEEVKTLMEAGREAMRSLGEEIQLDSVVFLESD